MSNKKISPVHILDGRKDATTSVVANVPGSTEALYGKVTAVALPNRKFPSVPAYVDAVNSALGLSLDVEDTVVFRARNWLEDEENGDVANGFGSWFSVPASKALSVSHLVFIVGAGGDDYHALVVEQKYFREVMLRGKEPSRPKVVDGSGRKTKDMVYHFYLIKA